ncbi:MAG TPA: diphosphate--fructose-6-phosphate 1-phosphotransferase [Chloroflexota bacterium]|nr:diphosphate--fructose-6-phosphate 1-phosphotransferase [Chloroflexota bacterium]
MSRNLIVGQSGGPTAVINASLAGVVEAAAQSREIDRIFGMRRGVEGLLSGEILELTSVPQERLDVLATTPGAALGACRRRISEGEAAELAANLAAREIGFLAYIGGNDSADTTHKLACAAGSALRAVAVPKTIDNDLPETDHCPGYGSAARYVAIAAAESTLDTRSLPTNYPVKIIEVMGRDAGWLAAASGLARQDFESGPHLIYVPEIAFDISAFLARVAEIHARIGYVVIVVGETVRDSEGKPVAREVASVDTFGHPITRGTAESLVRAVEGELGIPARAEKPGTLQRSSQLMQSPVDLAEARDAGREAVRLTLDGASDRMVTIQRVGENPYTSRLDSVELERVANQQCLLPRDFLDESGTFITESFRRYAMPLLGDMPFPDYARL